MTSVNISPSLKNFHFVFPISSQRFDRCLLRLNFWILHRSKDNNRKIEDSLRATLFRFLRVYTIVMGRQVRKDMQILCAAKSNNFNDDDDSNDNDEDYIPISGSLVLLEKYNDILYKCYDENLKKLIVKNLKFDISDQCLRLKLTKLLYIQINNYFFYLLDDIYLLKSMYMHNKMFHDIFKIVVLNTPLVKNWLSNIMKKKLCLSPIINLLNKPIASILTNQIKIYLNKHEYEWEIALKYHFLVILNNIKRDYRLGKNSNLWNLFQYLHKNNHLQNGFLNNNMATKIKSTINFLGSYHCSVKILLQIYVLHDIKIITDEYIKQVITNDFIYTITHSPPIFIQNKITHSEFRVALAQINHIAVSALKKCEFIKTTPKSLKAFKSIDIITIKPAIKSQLIGILEDLWINHNCSLFKAFPGLCDYLKDNHDSTIRKHECNICFNWFDDFTIYQLIPCQHKFCKCILKWLNGKLTCPSCRTIVTIPVTTFKLEIFMNRYN